LSAGFSS